MNERVPTSLEQAMVRELITLSVWIESLPDDRIDLDESVKLQEDITAVVQELGEADRATFVSIVTSLAAEHDARESGGGDAFREALEALGLLDEL
jgi:hypothetical protein